MIFINNFSKISTRIKKSLKFSNPQSKRNFLSNFLSIKKLSPDVASVYAKTSSVVIQQNSSGPMLRHIEENTFEDETNKKRYFFEQAFTEEELNETVRNIRTK